MTFKEGKLFEYFMVLKAEANPLELEMLSTSAPTHVLVKIANHSRTPGRTLARLAANINSDVRMSVGENQNTPVEVLRHLARDENPDVRYSLAENHNLSVEILRILINDENPYVAARAQRTLQRLTPMHSAGLMESESVSATSLKAFVACA
jgi:hypothetical protein